MPIHSITIKLDRVRNVFHQGEHISGKLILDNKYRLKHDGLLLSLEGFVDAQANSKSINNLLNTFNGSTRAKTIVDFVHQLVEPGYLEPGLTILPFKMLIDGSVDVATLPETYLGVFISIQYFIKCRIKRTLFFKDLVETLEFIIEFDSQPIGAPPFTKQPIQFTITPDSLSAPRHDLIPNFKFSGQLDSRVFLLDEPITGQLQVDYCSVPIKSIELQLVRVETIFAPSTAAGVSQAREFSRDATEVQNIQMADGDIAKNIPISVYMILPKLFTCPTTKMSAFEIGFEVNLVIIFSDNYVVTENFPIELARSTLQPKSLQ